MKNFKLYIHISPSCKYYVGITSLKNIEQRWGKEGNGYKTQYFKRAIDKYGWDNFIHIIVAENLSKNDACELEKLFINQLQSNLPEYGYNISDGGDCTMLGKHHSEESKQKISETFSEPVDQYNIDGKLIKSWNSMRDVARKINIDASSIAKCCKGIYKTSKGFVWRYKDEPFDKYTLNKNSKKTKMIKVKQYSKDGNLLKIWDGISIAASELNLSSSSISACCKGRKGRKSYGGYVWRYLEDDFNKFDIENEKIAKVIQYDTRGNIINKFNSIVLANENTGVSKSNISLCCSRKAKTAGGYIWRYENDKNQIDIDALRYRTDCKKVSQFDKDSLLIINTYHSLKEASVSTKIPIASIINCCKGIYKHAGGYVWKYSN